MTKKIVRIPDFHMLGDACAGKFISKDNPVLQAFPLDYEEEPTIKVKARFKGGSGSGFHGHKGRPGEVGGSTSGGLLTGHYVPPGISMSEQMSHIMAAAQAQGLPMNAPEPKIYDEEKAAVGPGWDKLNGVLQGWAIAEEASDSNMAILQGAAAHVFGGSIANEAQYDNYLTRSRIDKVEFEQAMKNLYDYTQSKLKDEHPSGEITLYRALHNIYDESVYPLSGKVALSNKVLSSWSSSKEGTTQAIEYWGRDMGYRLLEAKVPIKNILAYPGSTFAMRSQGENEFMVISTGTPVQADIIDSQAYKEQKMKLKFVYKGGKGSGFHGHAGIRGHQGGSASSGTGGIIRSERDIPSVGEMAAQERHNLGIGDAMGGAEEAARKRDAEGMIDATQIRQMMKSVSVLADTQTVFPTIRAEVRQSSGRKVWESVPNPHFPEQWKDKPGEFYMLLSTSRAESKLNEMGFVLNNGLYTHTNSKVKIEKRIGRGVNFLRVYED